MLKTLWKKLFPPAPTAKYLGECTLALGSCALPLSRRGVTPPRPETVRDLQRHQVTGASLQDEPTSPTLVDPASDLVARGGGQ